MASKLKLWLVYNEGGDETWAVLAPNAAEARAAIVDEQGSEDCLLHSRLVEVPLDGEARVILSG